MKKNSFLTVILRSLIIIGLILSVCLILYFTPLPNHYPQSCSRPCHELDWPMICRIKLTLERFQTLGNPCKGCPGNISDCYINGCITVDGQSKGILTVNRQFPGPTLEVCQYDIVLVDIVNRIPGQSFGVHWRGQSQSETPFMDGVPMITQCPIPSLTTFQYKFRASEPGTHIWQVNTGEEYLDTLFGPLIVKKPYSKEINKNYYDTDDKKNVVVIHTWNPLKNNFLYEDDASKTKLLINGKTQENDVPPFVFNVTAGKRHRFRVIYVGSEPEKNCQIRFSIDEHKFFVIGFDGKSIQPEMVTSVKLFPGERFDFVLSANQKMASYSMKATPVQCLNLLSTSALIQYEGNEKKNFVNVFNNNDLSSFPEFFEISTSFDEDCKSDEFSRICIQNIRSYEKIPKELAIEKPDFKYYLIIDSTMSTNHNIGMKETVRIKQINNLTMLLPSSPLVSQSYQISPDSFCDENFIPEKCKKNLVENFPCECVHVVKIPLNSVVELVLVNKDESDHVFHLHGYSFRIVGISKVPTFVATKEQIKQFDDVNKQIFRNFNYPVVKDTLALSSGYLYVIRFKADNPGYWLFDEENSSHFSKGLSLVFKVGRESDFPNVPDNFPKCGDWIGPEFFFA
ncbi:multicopper oxidase, putative [Pediculus humanus corporis]|uniref:Multicopper oxidase, putative n=1 Tax=Pediculus humanus subsp. corporis TaxID=121224 RepID=E0VD01_PEDHC|nr:multicopper oxidase, putative [Pediculus humanus corporis]EEB11257.1 multicopper oxidase, putative [Pediculus humanus corporis]